MDGTHAARRFFNLGLTGQVMAVSGAKFLEGFAVEFDVFEEFRGLGIARTLHSHFAATLSKAGVERILVKADRVGRAVWQRYYEWDYEQAVTNRDNLHHALYSVFPPAPVTSGLQQQLRRVSVRSAKMSTLPLRMRLLPRRRWGDLYDAESRVVQYMLASYPVRQWADLEENPGGVSVLLSSVNWHGVLCLSPRAKAHNEELRRQLLR